MAGTLAMMAACNNSEQKPAEQMKEDTVRKTIGSISKMDPSLDAILSPDAKTEIIAEGFDWSEGPLWLEKTNALIWSDVPKNTIYKWSEGSTAEIYLQPSGYTDTVKRGGEMGSNGLLLDLDGNLVLCQHGNRQMARMNSPVDNPKPDFITLASKYNGKRFSSPNDAVYSSAGELYFTDPPYGLENPSHQETPINGVYKVRKDGTIQLLVDSISRPNGIAFFPGEKKVVIACSDPAKPNWYVFDVDGEGLKNGKIFYSAAGHDQSFRGLPDGLKIDKSGNVFATGPGGVYIFNSEGKLLGIFRVEEATSNVAFSPDQKTLYITNDMYVLRLKLRD
jgi:gluconolactonase